MSIVGLMSVVLCFTLNITSIIDTITLVLIVLIMYWWLYIAIIITSVDIVDSLVFVINTSV